MSIKQYVEGKSLFRLGSAIVILIGAILPWLETKPDQFAVPAIYILGMDTGTEVGGFIFLPLTFLAAIAALRYPHGRKTDILTLAAGAVVVYISGSYVLTYSNLGSPAAFDSFRPTLVIRQSSNDG